MDNFEDILGHPHYVSPKRTQMSMLDRTAQFSPFAALTGYEDEVEETSRITDSFMNLTEDQSSELDASFQKMLKLDKPLVTVRYFKLDSRKSGGTYKTYTGNFRFFDVENNVLKFTDGLVIDVEMVVGIKYE